LRRSSHERRHLRIEGLSSLLRRLRDRAGQFGHGHRAVGPQQDAEHQDSLKHSRGQAPALQPHPFGDARRRPVRAHQVVVLGDGDPIDRLGRLHDLRVGLHDVHRVVVVPQQQRHVHQFLQLHGRGALHRGERLYPLAQNALLVLRERQGSTRAVEDGSRERFDEPLVFGDTGLHRLGAPLHLLHLLLLEGRANRLNGRGHRHGHERHHANRRKRLLVPVSRLFSELRQGVQERDALGQGLVAIGQRRRNASRRIGISPPAVDHEQECRGARRIESECPEQDCQHGAPTVFIAGRRTRSSRGDVQAPERLPGGGSPTREHDTPPHARRRRPGPLQPRPGVPATRRRGPPPRRSG
jgi:hypothetical protein